jgi:hypothetical protein
LPALPDETPTLYSWAGGTDTFLRLCDAFYAEVVGDDLLGPLFARMDPQHARYVAIWLAEVFGGPTTADTAKLPDDPSSGPHSSVTSSGAPGWRCRIRSPAPR